MDAHAAKDSHQDDAHHHHLATPSTTEGAVSRRAFVGTGLLGGAALLTGGWTALAHAAPFGPQPKKPGDALWIEKSIPELQALLASGALTSRELVQGYLQRIAALNPLLHAVIETNPQAVAIAAQLDAERRRGIVRGPLHGIPILLKDNIATGDAMQTTAGSLALYGCRPSDDAVIAERLRAAGAILLGKANLSEWANFRGFGSISGWSARGGFTRNPYLASFDPSGSSSGSAVAAAASLCAAAVGTETDGSIVSPSGNNLVVGLKPTLGLLSQQGIIPIAHSQDTAGPMTRTVVDAAILLGAMQSPFGEVEGHPLPADYTQFLQGDALAGRRIGVDRKYFTPDFGGEADLVAVAEQALATMESLGATLVDVDSGDPGAFFDDEFTVLLYEFKPDVEAYLATLDHCRMHTLGDLIRFNQEHCPAEMRWFGQELFEIAETIRADVTEADYVAALVRGRQRARDGIDGALQTWNVDAIVAPSWSFASSPAAVSGYPNLSLPVGISAAGRPTGLWMFAGFLAEPTLLAIAYALEQALQPRRQPTFAGTPPVPEDAGICATLDPEVRQLRGKAHLPRRHVGTGKAFPAR